MLSAITVTLVSLPGHAAKRSVLKSSTLHAKSSGSGACVGAALGREVGEAVGRAVGGVVGAFVKRSGHGSGFHFSVCALTRETERGAGMRAEKTARRSSMDARTRSPKVKTRRSRIVKRCGRIQDHTRVCEAKCGARAAR